jgi:hypothetical protein
MRRHAAPYRSWVLGLGLLALGWPLVVGAAPQAGRLGPFGAAPERVVFHSAAVIASHILPAGDKRPRPPGCDSLAAVLNPPVTLVCNGKPFPALARPAVEAASGGDRSAAPIRSPPGPGA